MDPTSVYASIQCSNCSIHALLLNEVLTHGNGRNLNLKTLQHSVDYQGFSGTAIPKAVVISWASFQARASDLNTHPRITRFRVWYRCPLGDCIESALPIHIGIERNGGYVTRYMHRKLKFAFHRRPPAAGPRWRVAVRVQPGPPATQLRSS